MQAPGSCEEGLTVQPREGSALLFYNVERPGDADDSVVLDPWSRHAACRLLKGEKLIANVWLHNAPVNETMAVQAVCGASEEAPRVSSECLRKVQTAMGLVEHAGVLYKAAVGIEAA